MGEARQAVLAGMTFNKSVKVEVREERLSDSGGAVLVREALERTGVLKMLNQRLDDPRDPKKITHPQSELLAVTLTMLALGWKDQDDADALRKDPMLRLAVSERRGDAPVRNDPCQESTKNPDVPQGLPSQPTLSRLLHRLGLPGWLDVLRDVLRELVARRVRAMNGGKRLQHVTLDIDAVPVPVSGHQPYALYNGKVRETMYHPMVTTAAELGDMISVRLRPGNASAAGGATEMLIDDVRWARANLAQNVSVRFDAGMPSPELMSALEDEKVKYVARFATNAVLDRMAEPYLKHPPGARPATPRTWFHEFTYAAKTWTKERRMVLVVIEEPDELHVRSFWLLTNMRPDKVPGEKLLSRYRRRGAAEGYFGELKDTLGLKLSSSHRGDMSEDWRSKIIGPVRPCDDPFYRANDALLQLNAIAYNVMHTLRTLLYLGLPWEERGWSLRRLRERVLRVAARITLHGNRVIVVVTQSAARYWSVIWKNWHYLDNHTLEA